LSSQYVFFIKLVLGEEYGLNHMLNQFNAGLDPRRKQKKTRAIRDRIENLHQRYYEVVIDLIKYLDRLSYTAVKERKWQLIISISVSLLLCLLIVYSLGLCSS